MATNTDRRDITLRQLTDIVKTHLRRGEGVEGATRILTARGWKEAPARQFVQRTAQALTVESGVSPAEATQRSVEARAGRRRMLRGAAAGCAGLLLIIVGLALAQVAAGFIFFAIGAILGALALVLLISGLDGWLKSHL